MYQEKFDSIKKEIEKSQSQIIIVPVEETDYKPKYFVYTDNQSSGDTIKRLCQI